MLLNKALIQQLILGDYCDVYLTHDSMSVRKAHNSGRNHLRNVLEYYQRMEADLMATLKSINTAQQPQKSGRKRHSLLLTRSHPHTPLRVKPSPTLQWFPRELTLPRLDSQANSPLLPLQCPRVQAAQPCHHPLEPAVSPFPLPSHQPPALVLPAAFHLFLTCPTCLIFQICRTWPPPAPLLLQARASHHQADSQSRLRTSRAAVRQVSHPCRGLAKGPRVSAPVLALA
ncbi:U1 zinc finger-domain-containing protein [Aspergillus heterothallicus]